MFDDVLLENYMHNFYGYGNWRGDFWFVGMEEGGIKSVSEMQSRIATWQNRGRNSLEDLPAYHRAVGTIGITRFLDEKAALQATWKHLIRIRFCVDAKRYDNETIRQYQRTQLGRQNADHCLLELLPLPSKSVRAADWEYHLVSHLPYLANRKIYQENLVPLRISYLRQRIRQFEPKVVVFYGANWIYRAWWQQIADVVYTETDPSFGMRGKTLFVIMKHPTAHGIPTTYFEEVGYEIRTRIGSSP